MKIYISRDMGGPYEERIDFSTRKPKKIYVELDDSYRFELPKDARVVNICFSDFKDKFGYIPKRGSCKEKQMTEKEFYNLVH